VWKSSLMNQNKLEIVPPWDAITLFDVGKGAEVIKKNAGEAFFTEDDYDTYSIFGSVMQVLLGKETNKKVNATFEDASCALQNINTRFRSPILEDVLHTRKSTLTDIQHEEYLMLQEKKINAQKVRYSKQLTILSERLTLFLYRYRLDFLRFLHCRMKKE